MNCDRELCGLPALGFDLESGEHLCGKHMPKMGTARERMTDVAALLERSTRACTGEPFAVFGLTIKNPWQLHTDIRSLLADLDAADHRIAQLQRAALGEAAQ